MSTPDRIPATNVGVFTLGGADFLDYLHNATWKGDVKHEEGKGVRDFYRSPEPTEGGWDIEADMYVGTGSLSLVQTLGQKVNVVYTLGGISYSGQALMTGVSHTDPQSGLQMHKITLIGRGEPTIVSA